MLQIYGSKVPSCSRDISFNLFYRYHFTEKIILSEHYKLKYTHGLRRSLIQN